MSKAKDMYLKVMGNIDSSSMTGESIENYVEELETQVESIMNFITILIDEDLVKDEGILLLDKIVKAQNIKAGG